MTAAYTMHQVADVCGYSWERFRKVWRTLPGFPAPFKRPYSGRLGDRGTYAWIPDQVHAWREARSRSLGEAGVQPEPANDALVTRSPRAALDRQREAIRRMMAEG